MMGLGTGAPLVETFVSLLALLEDHSSHHGADNDAQQRTEQEQEHLPARQRPTPEVPCWVIHVVCKGNNSYRDQQNLGSCGVLPGVTPSMPSRVQPRYPNPSQEVSSTHRLTFGGFKEADARLNLGPVNALIFYRVLHHELEQLHRDNVVIVCRTTMSIKHHQKL